MEWNNKDENFRWEIHRQLDFQNLQIELLKSKAHPSTPEEDQVAAMGIIHRPLPETVTHEPKSEAVVCLQTTPQQQTMAATVRRSPPKTVNPQSQPVAGVCSSSGQEVALRQPAEVASQGGQGRFNSYQPYWRRNRGRRWRTLQLPNIVVQIGGRPNWGRSRRNSQWRKKIYIYIN